MATTKKKDNDGLTEKQIFIGKIITKLGKEFRKDNDSSEQKQAGVPKGICYWNLNCKKKVNNQRITKATCKFIGGKSWNGPTGCVPA